MLKNWENIKVKTIGIIGYGRFGKILSKLLIKKYKVKIFDPKNNIEEDLDSNLEEVLESFIITQLLSFEPTFTQAV